MGDKDMASESSDKSVLRSPALLNLITQRIGRTSPTKYNVLTFVSIPVEKMTPHRIPRVSAFTFEEQRTVIS
jgi:hypothetical protein